mmetsp:Transcript_21595/g.50839  ORF Transcript_21595/g.50839 Transcript_21595/m.50839 type:complete len:177 (-) Transcript_21595:1887-2417(-)
MSPASLGGSMGGNFETGGKATKVSLGALGPKIDQESASSLREEPDELVFGEKSVGCWGGGSAGTCDTDSDVALPGDIKPAGAGHFVESAGTNAEAEFDLCGDWPCGAGNLERGLASRRADVDTDLGVFGRAGGVAFFVSSTGSNRRDADDDLRWLSPRSTGVSHSLGRLFVRGEAA